MVEGGPDPRPAASDSLRERDSPAIVVAMRRLTCLPIGLCALLAGCEGELTVPMADPVADAGFDQVRHITAPSDVEVTLDGRASCDPMGEGLSGATWTIVSAPAGHPEVSSGDGLTAKFTASEPGEYLVSLVVTAGERASEPDYMAVSVVDGDGEDVLVAPPVTDACGQPLE